MTVKERKSTNTRADITNKLLIQGIMSKMYTNPDKIDIGEDSFDIFSGGFSVVEFINKLKKALDKKNGIEEIDPDDLYFKLMNKEI